MRAYGAGGKGPMQIPSAADNSCASRLRKGVWQRSSCSLRHPGVPLQLVIGGIRPKPSSAPAGGTARGGTALGVHHMSLTTFEPRKAAVAERTSASSQNDR